MRTGAQDGVRVRVLFPALRGVEATVEELVHVLGDYLCYFCLPRTEIAAAEAQHRETGLIRFYEELFDRARKLFIAHSKSLDTSGEPAEVLLFVLLEMFLRAPQVACKMYLKTNRNMPVHGADAVHLLPGGQDAGLVILWGESKTRATGASAAIAAAESIRNFLGDGKSESPRSRDVRILLDHMNVEDEAQRAWIRSHFNPYDENSNSVSERCACLLVCEDKCFADLLAAGESSEGLAAFDTRMQMLATKVEKAVHGALKTKDLTSEVEVVFVMIVPSVAELRVAFCERLGIKVK